jgi:hypothetical protein
MLPFAGIAFLWFVGVLRDRLGELEDRFFATVFLGSALLYLAMLVGLWRHWQRAGPALRRALLPITVAAPLQLAIIVAWHLADANATGLGDLRRPCSNRPSTLPASCSRSASSSACCGRGCRAAPSPTSHSCWGAASRSVECARHLLARSRPTLQVAFPAPSGGGFVDPDGQPVELPPEPTRDRGLARLEHEGELLAILSYDPAIEAEDPGRVEAVASMARLALENERLAAQVRAQLDEVRASRRASSGGGHRAPPDRARPATAPSSGSSPWRCGSTWRARDRRVPPRSSTRRPPSS